MSRYWLIGPMTDIESFNYPMFLSVVEDLRSRGHDAYSPIELESEMTVRAALASPDGRMPLHGVNGQSYADFLTRTIRQILIGPWDAIVALPGWERSRGARIEAYVAKTRGLAIVEYGPDDPLVPIDFEDLQEALA